MVAKLPHCWELIISSVCYLAGRRFQLFTLRNVDCVNDELETVWNKAVMTAFDMLPPSFSYEG
jgi:hypothetical protein